MTASDKFKQRLSSVSKPPPLAGTPFRDCVSESNIDLQENSGRVEPSPKHRFGARVIDILAD
jgi:hypothetical protein